MPGLPSLITTSQIVFSLLILSLFLAAHLRRRPDRTQQQSSPTKPPPVLKMATTPLAPRTKMLEDIERRTGRRVAIYADESEASFIKCDPQMNSPLFTLLPQEIRDLVWAFATAPMEDKDNPYKENAYYYRPGHKARLKTDCALLLTCRRVWLEAHAYPMLQAEHSFWYYRQAPDARTKEWMANLTPLNRKHFGTLHLYAQMYAIESLTNESAHLRGYFLPDSPRHVEDFQPAKFHVTLRHTDWWDWESEAPLRFQYSWFQAMLDSPDLRRTETLKLELETMDYKAAQLSPIVDRIRSLESKEFDTHLVNDRPTSTKFVLVGEPEVTSWTGPTNIDGVTYAPYDGKKELRYHAVTLTWKLHFSEYPNAYIPRLRLSPEYFHKRPAHRAPYGNLSEPADDIALFENESVFNLEASQWRHRSARHNRQVWRSSRRRGDATASNGLFDVINPITIENAQDVQEQSSRRARVGELYRRREFWRGMKPHHERHWQQKFAKQKSLLKLE